MPGLHLMIDASGCNPALLDSPESLTDLLWDLPTRIGMQIALSPTLEYIHSDIPDDSGYSGFVIIKESHIALHTWPALSFLYLDVFSCKTFDIDLVIEHIRELFAIKDLHATTVVRGRNFPDTSRSI